MDDPAPVTLADIERARDARDRADREWRTLIHRGLDQTDPRLDGTQLAKAAGVSRARVYQIRDEERAQILTLPDGRAVVLVMLTFGDEAHVVTPEHSHKAPLKVPSQTIADQAGIPANELPGLRFAATRTNDGGYTGFELLDDPRR